LIYYSIGADKYLLKKKSDQIFSKTGCEEPVIHTDGAEELLLHLEKKSFFARKRAFLASNLFEKTGSTKKDFINIFKSLPDDDVVVVLFDKKPKVTKEFDWLKKNAKELKCEAHSVSPRDFIKEIINNEGGEITPLALERLSSLLGSDFQAISEEVKKLILYKTDDGTALPIEHTDVENLVSGGVEKNIFSLIDAVATKNKRLALRQIRNFIESGENALYIHAMIYRQIRNIAFSKFNEKMSESALSKNLGIHPFVAKKTLIQSKNFSRGEVFEIYNKLAQADFELKSGTDPEEALYKIAL